VLYGKAREKRHTMIYFTPLRTRNKSAVEKEKQGNVQGDVSGFVGRESREAMACDVRNGPGLHMKMKKTDLWTVKNRSCVHREAACLGSLSLLWIRCVQWGLPHPLSKLGRGSYLDPQWRRSRILPASFADFASAFFCIYSSAALIYHGGHGK
jgi:hypothetical protein